MHQFEVSSSSLSELVNSYPFLKLRGFDFSFLKGEEYDKELKARAERERNEYFLREASSFKKRDNVKSRMQKIARRRHSSSRSALSYLHQFVQAKREAETAVVGLQLDSLILVYLAEPFSFR